jgi:hypothetical protein
MERRFAWLATLIAVTGCSAPGADVKLADRPGDCESEAYPCSWDDVDPQVWQRTVALADPALERMYQQSPSALWEWLQTVPDVADAGLAAADSSLVWFRLHGGRPAYVMGPHVHRTPASGPGSELESVGSELLDEGPLLAGFALPLFGRSTRVWDAGATLPHPSAEVTGRDRNEDTRVNQRDQRSALVMDPFYFEKCYGSIEDRFDTVPEKKQHRDAITAICEGRAEPESLGLTDGQIYAYGRQVKAELEAIDEYRGNVTLLEDMAADHRAIKTWSDYDVVHVTAHGAQDMVGFGWLFPTTDDEPVPLLKPFPGALPIFSNAGRFGPKRGAWAADAYYFQSQLSSGLDRTLVFLATCSSLEGPVSELQLIQHLASETSGVLGWTNLVDYDDNAFLGPRVYDLLGRGWTVRQALDTLRLRRSQFLQAGADLNQAYVTTELLDYAGEDLRILEVVRLIDPANAAGGTLNQGLLDGAPLNRFLAGRLGDEVEDTLTVDAEVRAVTDQQVQLIDVQLELDGTPIGQPLPLDPEKRVGANRFRVRFDRVLVGKDLEPHTDYELEAIASLPEGGQSRYAVRLRGVAPYAVITELSTGAGESGGSPDVTTGPGPSGAEVDQPLGIQLDSVPPGRLFEGATTRYPYDPSLTEPCVLSVGNLYNAQGDMLGFRMDHEGPIGPGDYPVTDGRQRELKYAEPLPPGQVEAGFVLGFLNQPPADQLQAFTGVAGTLTVHSVAGRFVTGTLYLTGENDRARAIARGWEEPPANYLAGAAIRVEFGLFMQDPSDPMHDSGAINCLTSEPNGGGGGSTTGSEDSSSDPGDDSEGSSGSSGSGESEGAGGSPEEGSPKPGSDQPSDPSDDPSSAARPSESDVANLGPGETRWVRVHAEGRPDLSFYGSDVDGSAGVLFSCHGTAAPASIALFKGEPGMGELELGALTSAIPESATGSFPLALTQYVVGGQELEWTETGSLEITRHDASADPASRRIAGRIVGLSMRDGPRSDPIPIEADFDMNAACVEFGR